MSGWLRLTIVKGRNLLATDSIGKSDPLVRVSLDGSSAPMKTVDGAKVETNSKMQTLAPVWNEEFMVPIENGKGTLRFDVWDVPMSKMINNLANKLNPVSIPKMNFGDLGDETFMGRREVEVGLGTEMGSAGEAWITLKPRSGNAKDKAVWDKKGSGDTNFGEIYVKWYWTYSLLGKILAKQDISIEEEVKEEAFVMGKFKQQIDRFSVWCYNLSIPWWWLSEKFMWEKPCESLFVLWAVTMACLNDWLSELFFGMLVALLTKWLIYRSVYGPYGEPLEEELPTKNYPDPFAWMRATENLTLQLQQTQNLCAMISDQCDYVVEVLTWERQETASSLTKFLALWTVLAAVGYWPPFRYILLVTFWYMFTMYPLMFKYPKAYKALTSMGSAKAKPETIEEVVEEPTEPEAEGQIPACVRKVLETYKTGKWDVTSENDIKFEKSKFPWCNIPVCRFSTIIKTSSEKFFAFIDEHENGKQYDALLKTTEMIEKHDLTAVVYLAFKTPVPFVTPRDVLVKASTIRLLPEDLKEYNLMDASGNVAAKRDCADMNGAFVTGAQSIVHPDKPVCSGYVRGNMMTFGWIVEPLGPNEIRATMILGMDPRGMLPAKAVDLANYEQVAKLRKLRNILEAN